MQTTMIQIYKTLYLINNSDALLVINFPLQIIQLIKKNCKRYTLHDDKMTAYDHVTKNIVLYLLFLQTNRKNFVKMEKLAVETL